MAAREYYHAQLVKHELVVLPCEAPNELSYTRLHIDYATDALTPLGEVFIAFANERICFLGFAADFTEESLLAELAVNYPDLPISYIAMPAMTQAALFTTPLLLKGTAFQLSTWQALCAIPAAKPLSYSQLAELMGRSSAVRAIASCVAKNPISWLIPCHRVLPKNGGVGQYRWGSALKQTLLNAEAAER